MPAPILVTGAAGFIGFHVAQRLLRDGHQVVGVDSFTPYYDVALKEARLRGARPAATAFRPSASISPMRAATRELFHAIGSDAVIHLAAQPGVRFVGSRSPTSTSNLVAFTNMLEACRHGGVEHLVYASSSSVYGANRKLPFSEHDPADHPVSLYAATKKANEVMAHSYAHLFGLPVDGPALLHGLRALGPARHGGLRLHPRHRPRARRSRSSNAGKVWRDFTYVDDIVEGVVRAPHRAPSPIRPGTPKTPDPATSAAPYRLYNIGNDRPEELNH